MTVGAPTMKSPLEQHPHRTTVIDADLAGQFPNATKVTESFFPGIPAPRMDP